MYPVLFHFVPTYGLLFALSVLVAWWWFVRRARSLGLPDEPLFNLTFYTLLAGILGAKLLLVAIDWRYYLDNPSAIVGTLRSAGVLVGGLAGGALAFTWYARRHGFPVLALGDAIAAPLALAQSIGRVGCFLAGCCWGKPAAPGNPFAVTFTNPASNLPQQWLGVPLIPIQLVQMGNDLLLTLILTLAWRRRLRPEGAVLWLYLLLYGVSRGIIEFWRGDSVRGLYFGERISTSQGVALAAILLALTMLVRGRLAMRRDAGT